MKRVGKYMHSKCAVMCMDEWPQKKQGAATIWRHSDMPNACASVIANHKKRGAAGILVKAEALKARRTQLAHIK